MSIDLTETSASYSSIWANFKYESGKSHEYNVNELKKVYAMPPINNAVINDILRVGINQFSPNNFVRSPEEQERCRALTNRARDLITNKIVRQQEIATQLSAEADGKNLGRNMIFLRLDGTEESHKTNKRLQDVCFNHPEQVDQFRYEEIMRSLSELNIHSPRDLSRLFELSDEELLNQYEQIHRCVLMMSESETLCKPTSKLTPEQRSAIQPYIDLGMQLAQVLEARVDLMANPFFSILDPNRLFDKNVAALKIRGGVEDAYLSGRLQLQQTDAVRHPLAVFFTSLQLYTTNNGRSIPYRFAAEDPALQTAVLSTEKKPGFSLQDFQTVVAHTQDGRDLVLTNTLNPKPQSVEEYTKQLAELAAKADKRMLTGSKEFTGMMRSLNALIEARGNHAGTAELQQKTDALVKAAEDYFARKHKQGKVDISNGFSPETLLHAGKNKREQFRLEVAATILQYARAQSITTSKVAALEAEAAKNAPKPEAKEAPKKDPLELQASALVNRNLTFFNLGKNFNDATRNITSRATPQEKIVNQEKPTKIVDGKKVPNLIIVDKIPQDEFDALCTMACGSKDAFYKSLRHAKNDEGEKLFDKEEYTVMVNDPNSPNGVKKETRTRSVPKLETAIIKNTDPDAVYTSLLDGIQRGLKRVDSSTQTHDKIMSGTSKYVSQCLVQNKFDALGKLLADGIRMNNKIMQSEKRFSDKFCTCARLNEKALEMLQKYPALDQEVMKNLTPKDMTIAKVGQALYNVHRDGIEAQRELIIRSAMPRQAAFDAEDAVKENKMNVAKVCQMYDTERKLVSGQLDLETINPQKYTKDTANINKALQHNQTILAFIDDLKGKSHVERLNLVGNPHRMGDLYDAAALNQQQVNHQQELNQFQYKLQANPVQQEQPKQHQQDPFN